MPKRLYAASARGWPVFGKRAGEDPTELCTEGKTDQTDQTDRDRGTERDRETERQRRTAARSLP